MRRRLSLEWRRSLSCIGEGCHARYILARRHVYIVVCRGVVSLGTFLCFVVAGRSRVALRVSREVWREVLGPDLSPFGNLTMIALVGWICRV